MSTNEPSPGEPRGPEGASPHGPSADGATTAGEPGRRDAEQTGVPAPGDGPTAAGDGPDPAGASAWHGQGPGGPCANPAPY